MREANGIVNTKLFFNSNIFIYNINYFIYLLYSYKLVNIPPRYEAEPANTIVANPAPMIFALANILIFFYFSCQLRPEL